MHHVAHALAQGFRAGCEHHLAPGAHQQLVAGGLAQAREGTAHGRGAQAQAARAPATLASAMRASRRDEQVEVGIGHAAS
jgi:hypothetical protein